ncbi:MAG: helix-turn-helix domain-containing protein [Alphaproteobacteria bacterium]
MKAGLRERRVMAAVGRSVQAHREAAGLSRAQLAAALGVLPATVASWEAGRVSLGVDTTWMIAAACGVPVTALFDQVPKLPPRRIDVREFRQSPAAL